MESKRPSLKRCITKVLLLCLVLSSFISCVLCMYIAITQFPDWPVVKEHVPEGHYCGGYSHDMVVGKLNIKPPTSTVDIYLKGFGSETTCYDEQYTYDPKTHHAVLVGATDPEDCVGKMLHDNHLSLDITYNPAKDIVNLDIKIAKIECSKC